MSLPYEPPTLKPLPPGPWDTEPSVVETTINGFSCAIIRTQMGHLCGYVLVPKDHAVAPFAPYLERDLSVHGGITYNGESPEGHWLGFDCAHSDDLVPLRGHYDIFPDATYRDISYVTSELTSLTSQLVSYSPSPAVYDRVVIRQALEALASTLHNPQLAIDLITSI